MVLCKIIVVIRKIYIEADCKHSSQKHLFGNCLCNRDENCAATDRTTERNTETLKMNRKQILAEQASSQYGADTPTEAGINQNLKSS